MSTVSSKKKNTQKRREGNEEWREGVRGIRLRFWKGLGPPRHVSIPSREHKEHYAWGPEGLWAQSMLSPRLLHTVTHAPFLQEYIMLQYTHEYIWINEGLWGHYSHRIRPRLPPHCCYWSRINRQPPFRCDNVPLPDGGQKKMTQGSYTRYSDALCPFSFWSVKEKWPSWFFLHFFGFPHAKSFSQWNWMKGVKIRTCQAPKYYAGVFFR